MPRNCWTRCNKTFPCSFLTREKTREIESRETSRRLEKQAISALLRKMIYKFEFGKAVYIQSFLSAQKDVGVVSSIQPDVTIQNMDELVPWLDSVNSEMDSKS